ncbi:hypothetical protein E1287_43320 [Actinomadura sp. KC06]|nr:hypothetical protein E1287_43320 [Actinomadura sp. KC06]
MAHYCDVETQKGGGCRRRVNAATCYDHVNGPVPPKSGGSNGTPVRSRNPVWTEAAPIENASITLPDAVTVVQRLPTHWRGKIAEQSVRRVGREQWGDFLQERTAGLCRPLARTARELLAIKARVDRLPGEAAAAAAHHLGAPPVVQTMAERFASGLGATTTIEQNLAATAHAVRVLGIFVCVITDAVPTCQCLKDLVADHLPRDDFETSLWHLTKPPAPT